VRKKREIKVIRVKNSAKATGLTDVDDGFEEFRMVALLEAC
jgi:hypothetical protein